jgi:hypothetical protein
LQNSVTNNSFNDDDAAKRNKLLQKYDNNKQIMPNESEVDNPSTIERNNSDFTCSTIKNL